jgi:general secretion pathway protein G
MIAHVRRATLSGDGAQPASAGTRGFTVAELITVAAIIGLRKITDAIDHYHDYRASTGPIQMKEPKALGSGDYPKKLDDLVKGFELTDGRKIKLLRERELIDPMTGQKEWNTLSTTDDPDTTSSNGDNVFEVHSKSTALALDGKTHYNEW